MWRTCSEWGAGIKDPSVMGWGVHPEQDVSVVNERNPSAVTSVTLPPPGFLSKPSFVYLLRAFSNGLMLSLIFFLPRVSSDATSVKNRQAWILCSRAGSHCCDAVMHVRYSPTASTTLKLKQDVLIDFVIMSQTRELFFINSCVIVAVLNIAVPGIFLFFFFYRLHSVPTSTQRSVDLQVRILPLHIFAYLSLNIWM